jgi:hypothetical protein
MGAPFAFECRRLELEELGKPASDMDIVQSFLSLIDFGGDLLEYLSYGKMSVILGDTIYVHGGITKTGLGLVVLLCDGFLLSFFPLLSSCLFIRSVPPVYNYSTKKIETIEIKGQGPIEWTKAINSFAYREVSISFSLISPHLYFLLFFFLVSVFHYFLLFRFVIIKHILRIIVMIFQQKLTHLIL